MEKLEKKRYIVAYDITSDLKCKIMTYSRRSAKVDKILLDKENKIVMGFYDDFFKDFIPFYYKNVDDIKEDLKSATFNDLMRKNSYTF